MKTKATMRTKSSMIYSKDENNLYSVKIVYNFGRVVELTGFKSQREAKIAANKDFKHKEGHWCA
jgi:hypothetical protein